MTWRSWAGIESELASVGASEVLRGGEVAPWRRFRWYRGQAHYSGLYWSVTTGGHVAYESRLELARVLLADFDPQVDWMVAQPFLVEAQVAGRLRRHVPDIALIEPAGVVTIVNVKPPERLGDPKVAATFEWAGRAFATRGWRHEVWTGAPEVQLGNIRFLAGYRHPDRFDTHHVDAVMAMAGKGDTIGEVERRCHGIGPPAKVRPALLHLLWVGPIADRADDRPVRPERDGACRMTTWTTTMAVGTKVRYQGEVHTVTAIEGSLVTFRSQRGRAWVTDARQVLADGSTVVGGGPGPEQGGDGVGELFANLTDGENDEIAERSPTCERCSPATDPGRRSWPWRASLGLPSDPPWRCRNASEPRRTSWASGCARCSAGWRRSKPMGPPVWSTVATFASRTR